MLDDVTVAGIVDWLIEQALIATASEQILAGCCERVNAAGLPIVRGHCSASTLHPQFEAVSASWHRDRGSEAAAHEHGASSEEPWQRSPLLPLTSGEVRRVRHRLAGEIPDAYPVLREFRDLGGTDYVAFVTQWRRDGRFDDTVKTGMISSWITDRPGGFADAEIAALERAFNKRSRPRCARR